MSIPFRYIDTHCPSNVKVKVKVKENALKLDLGLRNVTNMDSSDLSADLQTTAKRALSKGQVESTL